MGNTFSLVKNSGHYLELGEAVTVGEDVSEHVEEEAVHGEGGEPGVHLQGEGAEAVPDTRPEPGVNAHLT